MPEATLDDIPIETAIHYAGRDADATLRVNGVLDRMLDDANLRAIYELDLSVIPMVSRMQTVGFRIDTSYFHELADHLNVLMDLKIDEIYRATGHRINPDSPPQTEHLLFTILNMPTGRKTRGGGFSTNDKVLEALRFKYPIAGLVCDYRELSKLRNSFAVVLPKSADSASRIHPRFKVTRVSSGRLACQDPNLLAIPVRTELGKLIRGGFQAGTGRILGGWDLDQIEMREMAHQSGDERMVYTFNEAENHPGDKSWDIHNRTGAMVFGCDPRDITSVQRYASKRIGFGVITGITEIGLAEQMALAGAEGWDEGNCAKVIREYFKVHGGVYAFLQECRAQARRYGFVTDRWGRIRYLPGVHSELSWVREEALRQSHSFRISASAQGTLKHGMKAIWDWWKGNGWTGKGEQLGRVEPLLQIHDELLVDMEEDKELNDEVDVGMIHFMCHATDNVIDMRVPIKAKGSVAHSWDGLKD